MSHMGDALAVDPVEYHLVSNEGRVLPANFDSLDAGLPLAEVSARPVRTDATPSGIDSLDFGLPLSKTGAAQAAPSRYEQWACPDEPEANWTQTLGLPPGVFALLVFTGAALGAAVFHHRWVALLTW